MYRHRFKGEKYSRGQYNLISVVMRSHWRRFELIKVDVSGIWVYSSVRLHDSLS